MDDPTDLDDPTGLIDTARYPLDGPELHRRVAADLAADGCCVLPGFLVPGAVEVLHREGEAVARHAHREVATVNVYNTAPDADLPADHPARTTMQRGNGFVARDLIPAGAVIQRLYGAPGFRRFVAGCFGLPGVYELADPLSGLTLNVIDPGREHPWHFDTNEFTVSMLTREAEAGGVFEYCPAIRSAGAENLDAVREVLDGRGEHRVRRLRLRPGDLQLFTGRYSLHRVTEVSGGTSRHTAIFAYSERPGVIGTPERTRQLFGRVTPAHLAAQGQGRVDGLLI
jgi:hypothetical protein